MTTGKTALLTKLRLCFGQMEELGHLLTEEQWKTQTPCPGWTVQDLYSHVIGTELMLMGDESPEVELTDPDHVRNDIGRMNEQHVELRRAQKGAEVFDEYQHMVVRRMQALEAMSDEDFAAESWTPNGKGTYADLIQIRIMDIGVHEQDARDALGIPGHDSGVIAEHIVDRVASGLGFVVGKKVGAPDGTTVHFALHGGLQRDLYVSVDGRAALVDALDAPATTTLSLESALFQRLAMGRVDPEAILTSGRVEISGDGDLGEQIVRQLAFMI